MTFVPDSVEDYTTGDIDLGSDQADVIRYCVLDYSVQSDVDFYFLPIVKDKFSTSSVELEIGMYRVQLPLDWSILIADKHLGNLEIMELKRLNDRPFTAFILNPIKGYMPSFEEITISNIFPDITWVTPKLKNGHILAVPLINGPNPPCVFCVRDVNRLPESLDISKVFC